jgi:hypothetical protein
MSLVAGHHALPEDVQRTLAGLARRAPTRRALLAALRALRRGLGSGRS